MIPAIFMARLLMEDHAQWVAAVVWFMRFRQPPVLEVRRKFAIAFRETRMACLRRARLPSTRPAVSRGTVLAESVVAYVDALDCHLRLETNDERE